MPKEKITNGEIFGAYPNLEKLSGLKLPIKVSFQLAKLINAVRQPFQDVDKVRVGLIQKYGTKKDNQMVIGPESEKWSEFVTEFVELMAIEVELEFEKVILPETDETIETSILMPLMRFVDIK